MWPILIPKCWSFILQVAEMTLFMIKCDLHNKFDLNFDSCRSEGPTEWKVAHHTKCSITNWIRRSSPDIYVDGKSRNNFAWIEGKQTISVRFLEVGNIANVCRCTVDCISRPRTEGEPLINLYDLLVKLVKRASFIFHTKFSNVKIVFGH